MRDVHWWLTKDGDDVCRELFDRHYSRHRYADGRTPKLFVGPGEKVVLRTWCGLAMWVWRKFIDDSGQRGVCCAVFRNETCIRSSQLVREACAIADVLWPRERRYTHVNPHAVKSRNPGYCFLVAGWRRCGVTKKGLLVLEQEPTHA